MSEFIGIFPWNKNFETGIAEIDEQHRVLVKLLNQLASHLGSNSALHLLDETFVELADYAVYHFQSEEHIWEGYFPTDSSLKGHKKTHENFIQKVLKLKKEEEFKPVQEVIEDVLSFLTHWLAHHILDSDMRMSKVVLGMQAGLSLEAAQQQAEKEMSGVMAVMMDTTLTMYDHLCERTIDLKREINNHKITEEKIQIFGRVFNDAHDGITITDAGGIIIDVNPAFCEITGYSRAEVIGQNPSMLSSGKQGSEFYANMWQQINDHGYWQGEVWNRKKDGGLYAELLTISTLTDEYEQVVNYVGIFSDITQYKQQQAKLNLMVHYDLLTGLPNRALFVDRFHQAIAHSKRTETLLAICFLDLDDFKPVNDSYSHEIGDQLLVEVARRIKASIREEDTVSRQGGDEFAILLGEISSPFHGEQMLERINQALVQPYLFGNQAINISASIGVVLYPLEDADLDTLLRYADQAMYQAKLTGKNGYRLFNAEQDQKTIQKHNKLEEIEFALTHDELHLYYQPKVNMRTGEVFGAEALIRWIHPEKGLIPPLEFLPIIEGTELEIKLGDWVIEQAFMQLEHWQQQDIKLEISVNIASYHLQSGSFFSKLEAALERHLEVDSKCLQLEILESSALSDLHTVSRIIEMCQKTLGVNIALDDFGTGYSSLTHLRSLSANIIKIDQTFVRDMLDDPGDYAIIEGVIGLADSFGRDVIAEGVETTEHGLILLIMGCEQAQGYGIARPIPANELPGWLSDYTPNLEWQRCGNKPLSTKEKKVKLFRLVSEQWKDLFVANVQSDPESIEHWPIMGVKHCHCGHWLKRAQQEQLFEQKWLDNLNKAHEEIHMIAHALLLKYQGGELDTTRDGVGGLHKAFDEMSSILEQ